MYGIRIDAFEFSKVEKILMGDYGTDAMDAFIAYRLNHAVNRARELERLAAVAAFGEFKKHLLYEQALDYASK